MKKVTIFFLLVILLGLTGCDQQKLKTDAIQFKEEYESWNGKKDETGENSYVLLDIPEDNAIIYTDMSKILSILEQGTGVIYFGYPKCMLCRSMIVPLLKSADMVGIDHIYYYDATDIRDEKHLDNDGNIVIDKEGSKEYAILLNKLNLVLPNYEELHDETQKRLYFPSVIFVKDGTVIGFHEGTVNSHKNPNVLLNQEQEKELVTIYSSFMHQILGDVCDQNC